jgi:superfamily II DNA or RNA helicase
MLCDLRLQAAYHKGRDDIASKFYIPCIDQAISYDRAVGFFSSGIYVIAWHALPSFVKRGGKMRVICSPFLSEADANAVSEGYDERQMEVFGKSIEEKLSQLFADKDRSKATTVLATLVKFGVLDMKVAFLAKGQSVAFDRLFHDKVGLFYDEAGNAVAFKGSMNETWKGLSNDGNIESIDVYVTWEHERERARVLDEQEYFGALWDNRYPTVTVKEFPEAVRNNLIQRAKPDEWERLVGEVAEEIRERRALSADRRPEALSPRPHQADALANWIRAGRRGVLEHATGSGKTFTAICAARLELERGLVPLVVVPSEILLKQWASEIECHLGELQPKILRCGAGHATWRDVLGPWSREIAGNDFRIIVATVQTASRSEFIDRLRDGASIFLIGDEVHRLGSGSHSNVLRIEAGSRLGLSATPTRFGDPAGTSKIFDYFGPVVPPPFTIDDAIESGTLTPYFYFPRAVPLSEHEQTDWNEQSRQISVYYARYHSEFAVRHDLLARFNQMLIQRARITKNATGKIQTAVEILSSEYQSGARWLVYCENQITLGHVLARLRSANLPAAEYHSEMRGDRERTITSFATIGGILVSIRCLDEGVDIPSVTHALIMASSKNPREFIQRRGRVLRRAPGKTLAHVYDLVVVPGFGENDVSDSIVQGELARAIEFGKSAANPSAVIEIRRLASRYGIDVEALKSAGVEEDIDA